MHTARDRSRHRLTFLTKLIYCNCYLFIYLSELLIKGGNEDNSKIIFLISVRKHML